MLVSFFSFDTFGFSDFLMMFMLVYSFIHQ